MPSWRDGVAHAPQRHWAALPSPSPAAAAGRRWEGALAVAGAGLPLLLAPSLAAVLAGLVLVGVGTFFAQATATGFVGRAATGDRGSASGMYLACYFAGGLVGSAVLGRAYEVFGWGGCVAGIGLALALAASLALRLRPPAPVAPAPAHAV